LQAIAQRLELCISPDDMVARLGGDEFAMLLTGNDAHIRAEFVANCVIEAVNAPVELDGHYILPATSIGIAIGPDHGDDADTLLRNADLALYVAKHNGRNRFAAFAPGMDVAAQARRQLETDMRNALASDQLRLVYQPLVDINTREVSGYEALLRWEHPERGTVMPVDFIPVAEETGLIVQLGEWVIRTGLTELAHWHAPISLSINLSPTQMRSGNLIPTIINALARANVDPGRVEFEITETVLMHDTDANLAVLHRLRDIGVRISLDDFGTGYSSLNYLRSFPFDKIKIDRCFVTDVDVRTDCQAIVKAVTGLATSLGMTTTAEGVEHEAQLEELRAQGCSQVQGYLFSHAVPADQLTDLRRRAPILPHAADTVILPAIGTIPPRARRAA
jgi:predicted signal transduction protein with EAL and GGDEF domain